MQTLFLTRYSYFGKSDWRSNASNDPELLLDPARLEQRERLFEKDRAAVLARPDRPGLQAGDSILPRDGGDL